MSNRIFTIGDIHGCYTQLVDLVESEIQLTIHDKLIFLGDYIDRGPDSKLVIDYILNLQYNGFDIITLMGNHEAMLLDAYENNSAKFKWILNGGSETLKSFNIDSIVKLAPQYIYFFRNLKPYYELNNFLFVHAGFNDSIENPFSDNYAMLWRSKKQYYNPLLIDKTIIHGHSPVFITVTQNQVLNKSNVINLDGGCVYTKAHYGKLIALEIKTRTILVVE